MMTFWNVFFGVFAGIMAGVVIHLAVEAVKNYRIQKRMKNNLKFEIGFNIGRIDSLLQELSKYRNKVNGDALYSYFGFFHLSKMIKTTMLQMFFTGSIYKYLKHDEIGKLQNFDSFFSLGTEQFMNNQVNWNRAHFGEPGVKQLAIHDIDYWEGKFNSNKEDLQSVKNRLSKKAD